jgi:GntP family gluconate:H+ symporter
MPLLTACYLVIALMALLLLTDRMRLQPFLALVAVTAVFGLVIHMSISQIGNLFGIGFSNSLQSLGLVIVAAQIMFVVAEQSGGADRLASLAPRRPFLAQLATLGGTLAGIASTPAAALAVLMPLVRSFGRNRADGGNRLAVFLGLALSAGHGLLFPAPAVVAGLAILGAGAGRTFLIGLPLAIITALAGAIVSSGLMARLASTHAAQTHLGSTHPAAGQAWQAPARLRGGQTANRVAAALVIAAILLVALLAIQSLADIPSEPFGGGPARERLLGLGRPLVLIILGPGLVMLALNRWSRDVVSAEGWLGRAVIQAAPSILLIGAAGGFQRLLQETGMAELLGEKLLPLHLGILLPLLVAALMKTLQGSSLVAAITAAGMIQPLLAPLGLDSETGRALAVLAIGIGSMTVAHINDPFFWLIGENARLRNHQALLVVVFGMVVQALVAVIILEVIADGLALLG